MSVSFFCPCLLTAFSVVIWSLYLQGLLRYLNSSKTSFLANARGHKNTIKTESSRAHISFTNITMAPKSSDYLCTYLSVIWQQWTAEFLSHQSIPSGLMKQAFFHFSQNTVWFGRWSCYQHLPTMPTSHTHSSASLKNNSYFIQ